MRAPTDQRSPWPGVIGFLASVFVALLIETLAMRVLGGGAIFPDIVLIALFIWSIRRPWFLNPLVLLVVGLFHDLFTGNPLGIASIAYLIGFGLARDREADGTGAELGPMIVRFAILTGIVTLLFWGGGAVSTGAPAAVLSLIVEAILTILLFIGFGWAFARRQERSAFF